MKKYLSPTNLFALSIMLGVLASLASCGTVSVDWVNLVKFHDITYVESGLQVEQAHNQLQASNLGSVFAKVQFKLEGNAGPGYKLQNGDAAYLDVGTPVYTVKGYKPTFWLAAYENGRLVLFEADTNPHAKKGADLLNIGGKVQSIAILNDQEVSLAVIDRPTLVAELTSMVLNAPVDQNRPSQDEPRYFIAFYLKDGTVVERAYGRNSGELSRGIFLPKAFGTIIQKAVNE